LSGSWRIGTLAGIGIYLHWTFVILLGWVGITHFARGDDVADAVHGIVFIMALFGVVVLHELGHAMAARRYGITTRDITLLPIGGVARLERMPEDPKQELIVAIAGPAVNVVLAIVCALAIIALTGISEIGNTMGRGIDDLGFVVEDHDRVPKLSEIPLLGAEFLSKMLIVNVILVVFNLLPAFPMDGGRVLRATLAMKLDYVRATQLAATIGQMMAIVFGFLGLFFNPFLVFIALFVWMGAAAEASMVQVKAGLQGIPVSHAMITDFETVSPDAPLARAAEHVIAGFQHDFPVTEQGHVVGVLTKTDLLKALAEDGAGEPVRNVMRRDFETAGPSDMLESVFLKLQEGNCHSLPIVRDSELVGIVTMENVGEFLAIQSALKRDRRQGAIES
jgi:Zn-dependent protease/CBS domain-containing protein